MAHPLDETLVALDLETTGTDARRDRIIDVGAVKFRGGEEIGRYASLVNPARPIPQFVQNLTGITDADVKYAPSFRDVASDIQSFIANCRVVGHNIGFDIAFLRRGKIEVEWGNYDTLEMARLALPDGPEFSLERLSARFGIGHDAPHRALSDALASRDLFLLLLQKIEELPDGMLSRLSQLASEDVWSMAALAAALLERRDGASSGDGWSRYGLDEDALVQSLALDDGGHWTDDEPSQVGADFVERVDALFAPGGALSDALSGFESRGGQREMARAVAKSLAEGTRLIVEAGTGIGKSLAYLIPAAMYSDESDAQVVVSTNTINLQEQLLGKDFAIAQRVLKELTGRELEAVQLKGRSNYLCYKRWLDAVSQRQSTGSDTRVLAQIMNWLRDTKSGDSAELALAWDTPRFRQYSAEGCPPSRGRPSYPCKGPPCFMLKARSRANGADVLIVNHALLILDRVVGTGIVSEHAALIIDEAHHLQPVATDQLGFWVRESVLMSDLESLTDPSGLINRLSVLATRQSSGDSVLNPVPQWQNEVVEASQRGRAQASGMFSELQRYTSEQMRRQGSREMRILGQTRVDPYWRPVLEAWARFAPELTQICAGITKMLDAIGEAESSDDATVINASALLESFEKNAAALDAALAEPDPNFVYWSTVDERPGRDLDVEVRGAPLDVSDALREALFARESPTVLTGATLTSHREFDRFAATIGIGEREDLALASPFDFERAALVVVPEDIPAPSDPGYADAVSRMLKAVSDNTAGRTLALFTANAALNNAYSYLHPHLSGSAVNLLAQGRDGPAARVLRLLAASERALALGSMAMWEGIDLEEASIKSLVMTRLPFPVPSDPIHASRSERMANPFNDYHVPEAIIKFRQGFGRLIRSHTDRGVFVMLDRRILASNYAKQFQQAIPRCTVRRVTLGTLGDYVGRWHRGVGV